MSSKTNILVTGVTGYIGGSVLSRLLQHPHASSFNVTVLVRDPSKAEKLRSLGVNVVVGSHSDQSLMERLASDSDVVIATADADDLGAMRATLSGLKARHAKTGTPPVFIHTSGTGVLTDSAAGMYECETIYHDTDVKQMESIPPTQLHRNVDLEILNADNEGYVKTYLVIPSTIYGMATGKLVDLGIQNPFSLQIPSLIKASIDRRQAGMVGLGKNRWPNVHIDDVADLYIVLFDYIRLNPSSGHGREGYYFGENGEHLLYDVSKAIGRALVNLGVSESDEPTTFTKEELGKYYGGADYMGTNSRARADHSRAIGWKPTKTTEDMLASIRPEVEIFLKKQAPQVQ